MPNSKNRPVVIQKYYLNTQLCPQCGSDNCPYQAMLVTIQYQLFNIDFQFDFDIHRIEIKRVSRKITIYDEDIKLVDFDYSDSLPMGRYYFGDEPNRPINGKVIVDAVESMYAHMVESFGLDEDIMHNHGIFMEYDK